MPLNRTPFVPVPSYSVRLLGQQFQIHPPIVVDEEHILPVVAPLRNVMGTPGRHYPCEPWHDATLPSPHAAVNHKIGGCP